MLLTGISPMYGLDYLGEIILQNCLEKSLTEERIHKLERAFVITYDKCISKNTKIRNYSTREGI